MKSYSPESVTVLSWSIHVCISKHFAPKRIEVNWVRSLFPNKTLTFWAVNTWIFRYPPSSIEFKTFNDYGCLSEEQKTILPRYVHFQFAFTIDLLIRFEKYLRVYLLLYIIWGGWRASQSWHDTHTSEMWKLYGCKEIQLNWLVTYCVLNISGVFIVRCD